MSLVHISASTFIFVGLTLSPAFAGQHGHSAPPHVAPPATPHTTATTHGTTARTPSTPHTTKTTTTTTATTNPIASKISANPQRAARIERMLPPNMTLATASSGFRNQGQFIAALHVSQNLHIPFADLKRAMTGPHPMSLGQAIQTLRPSANSTTETTRARRQATTDLR